MDFLTYLAKEGAVIWQAPVTFLIAVVLAGLVAFALARWAYATRLDHAQSTITMLEKRLDRSEQGDAIAIAATVQASKMHDMREVSDLLPALLTQVPSGPREFLPPTCTPEHLISILDSQTDIQAQKALAEYMGKWLTFTGNVSNVTSGGGDREAMVAIPLARGRLLFCTFLEAVSVQHLARGDRVTVIGQLDGVNTLGVSLDHSELVP